MKKFLQRLGLFLAIQLVIGALLIFNAFRQPRYGYVAAFEDKVRLLREHDEPHLILIGGSNVAFGFDSRQLQTELGMPVINVGLHASTGLQFYLDVAEKYARSGDLVVLVPEWNLLNGQLYPEPKFIRELVRQSPSSWSLLLFNPGSSWKTFLDEQALPELAHFVQQGVKYNNLKRQQQAIREAKPMLYNRLNFNDQGDFVGHHKLNAQEVKYLDTSNVLFNENNYLESSQRINQCARNCGRRGAILYLAYAPIPDPVYGRSEQTLNALHKFLKSNLTVPILHPPANVRYPVSCFFDTVNHLNRQGKSIRTQMIASSLREYESQIAASQSRQLR